MERCHILDMTIADPPMEEIIAAIYGEKGRGETGDSGVSMSFGDAKGEAP
jgi:hypothetical protein